MNFLISPNNSQKRKLFLMKCRLDIISFGEWLLASQQFNLFSLSRKAQID